MTTRRKRQKAIAIAAALVVLAALAALLLLRQPAPVGHWRSAEGHDAFTAHCAEALAALPEPETMLDTRTRYGIVRAYRFAGGGRPSEAQHRVLQGLLKLTSSSLRDCRN